jgi:hypothetical protein
VSLIRNIEEVKIHFKGVQLESRKLIAKVELFFKKKFPLYVVSKRAQFLAQFSSSSWAPFELLLTRKVSPKNFSY